MRCTRWDFLGVSDEITPDTPFSYPEHVARGGDED